MYSSRKKVLEIKKLVSSKISSMISDNFRPDQLKWIALNGNPEQSEGAVDRLIELTNIEDAKDDDTEKTLHDRSFEATKALHHIYGLGDIDLKEDMEDFSRKLGV